MFSRSLKATSEIIFKGISPEPRYNSEVFLSALSRQPSRRSIILDLDVKVLVFRTYNVDLRTQASFTNSCPGGMGGDEVVICHAAGV